MRGAFPSAVIENLQPLIDGGRYPIKSVAGEDLVVEADGFKDGHDVVAALLTWRAVCSLYDSGVYEYTVEAWTDTFRGWQHEFATKFEAGISVLTAEALEGAPLLEAAGAH